MAAFYMAAFYMAAFYMAPFIWQPFIWQHSLQSLFYVYGVCITHPLCFHGKPVLQENVVI